MQSNKGKKLLPILILFGIMLTIIGTTYSYLAPKLKGVETESTVVFNSGSISITYNGSNNTIEANNVIPGWSDTKTFSVTGYNNTNLNDEGIMDYKISLVVLNNTFSNNSIIYNLTGKSTNSNDIIVPKSGSLETGADTISIGTGRFNQDTKIKNSVTHNYTLTISFPNNPNKSQNEDIGAQFSAYITIGEGALEAQTLTDYIASLASNDSSSSYLKYDDTKDKNIRYYGATPNNYVEFGNTGELWRIIGVFNVLNVDTGTYEQSVKIIRNEKLSDGFWTEVIEDETGDQILHNEWSISDLQKILNTTYLDYNLSEDVNINDEFYILASDTIKKQYQDYILNARWNTGGIPAPYDEETDTDLILSAYDAYYYERGNLLVSSEYDGITRHATWDGKIALAYPSDFGYASSQNECIKNILECDYETDLQTYNWMILPDCYEAGDGNIHYHSHDKWFLTPVGDETWSYEVYTADDYVNTVIVENSWPEIHPTLYLKNAVILIEGDGTIENPYKLSM